MSIMGNNSCTLISRMYMQTHYMYSDDMLKMKYFLSNNREKLE